MHPSSASFPRLGYGATPHVQPHTRHVPHAQDPRGPQRARPMLPEALPGRHAVTLRPHSHRPKPRGTAPASPRPSHVLDKQAAQRPGLSGGFQRICRAYPAGIRSVHPSLASFPRIEGYGATPHVQPVTRHVPHAQDPRGPQRARSVLPEALPGRHAATLRPHPHRPQPRRTAPASPRPSHVLDKQAAQRSDLSGGFQRICKAYPAGIRSARTCCVCYTGGKKCVLSVTPESAHKTRTQHCSWTP